MTVVDWRTRWGWPWISTVRNQGPCSNCWGFAMTALYEAMVRIEHCVWCRRSEADVVCGAGKDCRQIGNFGEARSFVNRYGLADPDCFPWTTAVPLYISRPDGGDLEAMPIAPTPDRSGRTLRMAESDWTSISDNTQRKAWIDAVGPMAVMVTLLSDFGGYGGGIYSPSPTARTNGVHALLVVGFDDSQQCWIVKNSWGSAWGEAGFARIAYGDDWIESPDWGGVWNTNPDPWTRRRLRTGGLLQSGNGAQHDNMELFVVCGINILHLWRDFGATAPWHEAGFVVNSDPFASWHGDDVLDAPAAIQSTFNRNFELIYRSNTGELRHVHYDQAFGWWIDDGKFGYGDAMGIPGLVQSTRGAPGDFEVVVATIGGSLQHWTKHNGAPWTNPPGTWYLRQVFGSGIAFGGPGLVQSRLGVTGVLEAGQGELHYVGTTAGGQIAHFSCSPGGLWSQVDTFGSGINSAPCLIQGQSGAVDELDNGNFELCVAANGHIEHWWRDNHTGGPWTLSATFGDSARKVVGLAETNGFILELVAQRTDGEYQHYYRTPAGWFAGDIIACPE
jgi:hypothetical protein